MNLSPAAEAPPPCTCPVAADHACAFAPLSALVDKSGKVGPQTVWQCRHCGLGVTMPEVGDVSFLYEGRESQDFQPDSTGLARAIKHLFFGLQARALLAQLPERPARVLDFGCGSGQFTRRLGDVLGGGVTGSDFHPAPPPELAGRPYLPAAERATAAGQFDLVLAMHVLEHDDDSAGLLARIVTMARPGGLVVIEVPNIDCVWARPFGAAWDGWYVPFHRRHFSRASLAGLVAAHRADGCRLEPLAIHDVSVPTFGRSLANLAGRGNSLPFLLAGAALHPVQWAGERLSGRPSALRLIARRVPA